MSAQIAQESAPRILHLVPSMSSPGASTPADASTLGTLTVTALNVGMNAEDSFKSSQGAQVTKLANTVLKWLEPDVILLPTTQRCDS